jgi:predicted nucleic acid-binding protein
MSKANLFLDSSALFAGIISSSGAARAMLILAESDQITITLSEQVVAETERAIARKVPRALADLREAIFASKAQIVPDLTSAEVMTNLQLISHHADVPILLAAMQVKVDYLVTHNRVHFLDDPNVAVKADFRIGMPGDVLNWVRRQISTRE